MVFYVIAEVDNYLENRIDPIAIIINGDCVSSGLIQRGSIKDL
jgi:hypothetical protein